ncbi:MAG: UDP-N-acetylmuramoyl-tripeptide--D-alanyl-D-alanine ligase [Egibacteraceae bacterium]
MLPLTLTEIAQTVAGRLHDVSDATARVTGPVVMDSREVVGGALFAALSGSRVDGHAFATAAIKAGAVATLAARPVGVPAIVVGDVVAALGTLAGDVVGRLGDVTSIALTGSSGKTSTKDLLAQVLERHGSTVATARSFNNEIGLPLTVLRADQTTRYLVLEMGARRRGDISHLTNLIPPRIGLVLNVGTAHIGEFGSQAAIAQAKAELVEALPADGLAVLNADDELVAAMAGRTTAEVLLFGRGFRAAVRAEGVGLDEGARARFMLHTPAGSAPVALDMLGEHQVSNALGAAAVAYGLGMSTADIADALSRARPLSAGRMEVHERADGVTVVNDAFNANPDSMRAGLRALAVMGHGRRTVAVLGEMRELGDNSSAEHAAIGRVVAGMDIDLLVAVGGVEAALLEKTARERRPDMTTVLVADRHAAYQLLETDLLRPGDVVLVKSSHAAGLDVLAGQLTAGLAEATL